MKNYIKLLFLCKKHTKKTFFCFILILSICAETNAQLCKATSGLVYWNFDNASDSQIDNSSGIATSSSFSCVTGLLKRTDGGSNSVYTNKVGSVSSDYGPVCKSSRSMCTGTWDSATPFDRYISIKVTYPAGIAGRLTGISFCEMTMAHTKSGGSYVTNNKPEKYQVRLLKRINGGSWTLVWTGSVQTTTQTDWTGTSSNPIPPASTAWGKYDSNSDGFSPQFVSGKSNTEFEFQISAFQNTDSSSSQEIWDIDELDISGCCCTTHDALNW